VKNQNNFPEQLIVVRSCHSTQTRNFPRAQALVVSSDGSECWRPGASFSDYTVNARRALERNAEAAAVVGIFAPEPLQGRRAA
jgi:hypothetical protein